MSRPTVFTVSSSGNEQVSNTTPMRCFSSARRFCGAPVTSSPNSETVPPSGSMRPRTVLMVVVLPAPLEPMKPTTLPAGTLRLTFSRSKPS